MDAKKASEYMKKSTGSHGPSKGHCRPYDGHGPHEGHGAMGHNEQKKILKEDSYFINKFFRWHNFCLVYTLQSQMASMEAGEMKISILSKCNHKSNTSS